MSADKEFDGLVQIFSKTVAASIGQQHHQHPSSHTSISGLRSLARHAPGINLLSHGGQSSKAFGSDEESIDKKHPGLANLLGTLVSGAIEVGGTLDEMLKQQALALLR